MSRLKHNKAAMEASSTLASYGPVSASQAIRPTHPTSSFSHVRAPRVSSLSGTKAGRPVIVAQLDVMVRDEDS
jgi:hypothetical protein